MRAATIIASGLLLASCRHTGNFVWVDELRSARPAATDYQVVPGDVISVRVLNHDDMSGKVRVRSDGRISLPIVGDVAAAGMTPTALADKLRGDLKDYVNNPTVTVTVDEPKPFTISVTGEVMRPGVYPLDVPASLLQALASAGGLSQFAHDDQIYVLRRLGDDGPPVRIRFKYEALAHAEGQSATFSLQRNDLVVVE
jgi:polysaccharide export outer membrane protein